MMWSDDNQDDLQWMINTTIKDQCLQMQVQIKRTQTVG